MLIDAGIRVGDVEYSDYYPTGSNQNWGAVGGWMLPTRSTALLTVEMKDRQRHRFEGIVADRRAAELLNAGFAVFTHK
jgi:hypothetical protein